MSEQLVVLGGIAEIAKRAGRPKPVVCNWADRGTYGFPKPLATLEMGRVWNMTEIEEWLTGERAERHGVTSNHADDWKR